MIGIVGRVFGNGPGDLGSIPGRVIPRTQKMVLEASLLNTQHYKVWIKGKVKQSKERGSALSYTSVAIEKGAFWSPSTTVANFIFFIEKRIGNMMYIIKHPRWKVRRHINQIKKDIPQTQRTECKNPCPSFMICLRYLGPHQYNNIVRANENVQRRELWK